MVVLASARIPKIKKNKNKKKKHFPNSKYYYSSLKAIVPKQNQTTIIYQQPNEIAILKPLSTR